MHPSNQSQVDHNVGLGRILIANLFVIAVILTFYNLTQNVGRLAYHKTSTISQK